MKSLILGLIAAAGVAAALPAAAQTAPAQTVDARAQHQEARIEQGVQTGALNPHEARRLEHRQHKLRRIEARMRARNGGALTPQDVKKLARIESHDSKKIEQLKSN
jgi:Ni/Co efflux regulator RcnB